MTVQRTFHGVVDSRHHHYHSSSVPMASRITVSDTDSVSSNSSQSSLLGEKQTYVHGMMRENVKGNKQDELQIVTALVEMQNAVSASMEALVSRLARKVDEQAYEIRSLKQQLEQERLNNDYNSRSRKKRQQQKQQPQQQVFMDHTEQCETEMIMAGFAIKQAVYAENVMGVLHELQHKQRSEECEQVQLINKVNFLKEMLAKTRKTHDREMRIMRDRMRELQQQQPDPPKVETPAAAVSKQPMPPRAPSPSVSATSSTTKSSSSATPPTLARPTKSNRSSSTSSSTSSASSNKTSSLSTPGQVSTQDMAKFLRKSRKEREASAEEYHSDRIAL